MTIETDSKSAVTPGPAKVVDDVTVWGVGDGLMAVAEHESEVLAGTTHPRVAVLEFGISFRRAHGKAWYVQFSGHRHGKGDGRRSLNQRIWLHKVARAGIATGWTGDCVGGQTSSFLDTRRVSVALSLSVRVAKYTYRRDDTGDDGEVVAKDGICHGARSHCKCGDTESARQHGHGCAR